MAGKVKRKEGERLDDDNIASVIALLEQAKPITQKEACERLNIAVNGTRLKKIIQEYKEQKEREKKFRAAKRGKPATEQEISEVIKGYLMGISLKEISDQLYRSTDFVKRIVAEIGVPQKGAGTYFSPDMMPEQCIAESFEVGEFVWAARYDALAQITHEYPYLAGDGSGSKVYAITVYEPFEENKMLIDGQRFSFHPQNAKYGTRQANQRAYDLGSLKHLSKYGVDLKGTIA